MSHFTLTLAGALAVRRLAGAGGEAGKSATLGLAAAAALTLVTTAMAQQQPSLTATLRLNALNRAVVQFDVQGPPNGLAAVLAGRPISGVPTPWGLLRLDPSSMVALGPVSLDGSGAGSYVLQLNRGVLSGALSAVKFQAGALNPATNAIQLGAQSAALVGILSESATMYGGEVSRVALPKHGEDGRTVVAMVDSNDQLRVKAYTITGGGIITPTDTKVSSKIPTARDVAIELVADGSSDDYYVTATRDGQDDLHLTLWRLSIVGDLTQTDNRELGTVSDMAIGAPWRKVSAVGNIFVVAVRDGQDRLRLISWKIIDGELFRQNTFVSGGVMFPPQALGQTEIRDIAVVTTLDGSLVQPIAPAVIATAFKDQDGDLRLYSWFVDDSGFISFRDCWEAGEVQDIAAFRIPDGVVTAVKDRDDKLRLISWTVSDSGNIVRRGTRATAWDITEVAGAMVVSPGLLNVAIRKAGKLWVTSWTVEGFGDYELDLVDIETRGNAANIDLARIHTGVSLVALRSTDSQNLVLTTYLTSY